MSLRAKLIIHNTVTINREIIPFEKFYISCEYYSNNKCNHYINRYVNGALVPELCIARNCPLVYRAELHDFHSAKIRTNSFEYDLDNREKFIVIPLVNEQRTIQYRSKKRDKKE